MPAPTWPDERPETKCAVIDRDLAFDVASSPDTSLDCQGANYRTAGAFILKIVCDKNLLLGNAVPALPQLLPSHDGATTRPSSRRRTRLFKASMTCRSPGRSRALPRLSR